MHKEDSQNEALFSHKKEWNSAISKSRVDLEGIMISETSQTEKDKYCTLPLICEI